MSGRALTTTQKQATTRITPSISGFLQRKCACGNHTVAGGECEGCTDKKGLLQRRPANVSSAGEAPPIVHEVLRSPGQPLDAQTRAFMEPPFGHDFSQVRVHTDTKAAQSALAVNALAYTVGSDVVFGPGRYGPSFPERERLLAHELAHVVQQSAAGSARAEAGILPMGDPHDPLEYQADALANAVLAQREASANSGSGKHLEIQMQTDPAGMPVLRKKDGLVGGGEEGKSKEPPKDTTGEKVEGAGAPAATPPCDPQGFSRAEYLKQSGTSKDDFGLTKRGAFGVPTVSTSKAATGKTGVTLDPTDAIFPSLTSMYTKEDTFIEGEEMFIDQESQSAKKYPQKWTIEPLGAQKIRAAEVEHCADIKFAFEISLRRYADVVNDLSKKNTIFASQKAAENHVTKLVGPAPDTWKGVFDCLVEKSAQARDVKGKSGWHTPLPRSIPPKATDKFFRKIVTEMSLMQVGRVPSQDIIKDCGEGPPVKAKGAAKPAGAKTTSALPPVRGEVGKE